MRRLLVCAALLAGAQPATAQGGWTGTARASVNVGTQLDTARLSESITLEKYVETTPVTAELPKKSLTFFDGGIAVRLAGSLGVGVAISYLTDTDSAEVAADIPHPFFFKRPRRISGQVANVLHKELATHINAVYVVASRRIDLTLSGGASLFSVEQDFVTDVAFTETYPYDTARFASATLTRATASKTGYNAGADVTWKIADTWGIGGLLRYSRADVPFTAGGLDVGTVEAGGLQAGAGLRLIF